MWFEKEPQKTPKSSRGSSLEEKQQELPFADAPSFPSFLSNSLWLDEQKDAGWTEPTSLLRVKHLQRVHHGAGEDVGVLLAAKVEAVDLTSVAPLVEGQGGLIVLQTLGDGTVDHHLEEQQEERRN